MSPVDAEIATAAACQHGVVSRAQLYEIGLSRDAITRRIAAGRLHSMHRGVYAVGHPRVSREGCWMAAVLACGPGAALSHRSAAALWGIRPYSGRIELTVPAARRKSHLFIARRSSLEPDERTAERGIPATTPARTLLDLAAVLEHDHQLDKAIRQAEYLRIFDAKELERLLQRHPRRPGIQRLRKSIATASAGMTITRSELEDRFRALLLRADLPTPIMNAAIELGEHTPVEVDALWPEHQLVAELDSRGVHDTAGAFEADRLRDRRLAVRGYTVLRITWWQLLGDPDQVIADITACTQRRSGRLPSAALPA
jgi:putative AbiEi antitoxin of type IV toxin-antitoxin system/transcriptional regulator with AbiEi antitoxin domain of type IV toxin-antitoxin system/uncharacterized protein DUF559